MASKRMFNLATFAAVSGLACSLVPASVTIYGGPTYDSSTGTGYTVDPNLTHLSPHDAAPMPGNATAVGNAWLTGGTYLGTRPVRWDASGTAATELGNLGTDSSGRAENFAYAINSAGTAVGSAEKYNAYGGYYGNFAVRWDASGTAATELGNLGNGDGALTDSRAYAINSAGTAAGIATKFSADGGYNHTYGYRAVRWDASGVAATELGNLGTRSDGTCLAAGYAINGTGTVAGWAEKYSGGTYLGRRAVRWNTPGTAATELGDLGTGSSGWSECAAYAINSAGTAAGIATKFSADGGYYYGYRAVRWDGSGTAATELGNIGTDNGGYSESWAYAINSAGTAAGIATKFSADGGYYRGYRAVRWDASGTAATELGNLGTDNLGNTSSFAYAINSVGVAVGTADKHDPWGGSLGYRAVFWGSSGVAIDLNTLLSPTDAALWTLHCAYGISDTNWVAGIGTFDPDGPGGQFGYGRLFLLQLPDTSCLSDFNHDGFVNGDDYDLFASLFDVADPGADINSDGFVNGDDYDAFASAFDAGC